MNQQEYNRLILAAKKMRSDILGMCYRCGHEKAHLGGCMSMVEILAVLYLRIMRFPENWEERDRFVLSKGHGAMCLYAALFQVGILTKEEISAPMRGENTIIYRHPKKNIDKGIEMSSGSLGMGLSYGIGLALAFKRKNSLQRVYVMLGDGECNEGSIWESALFAGHKKLDNLIVIVDKNGLQLDGPTKEILNMENMKEIWKACGFFALEIDGHDMNEIEKAFLMHVDRPIAIIANTIKGKGVSFSENAVEWHDNYLTEELYKKAISELGDIEYE